MGAGKRSNPSRYSNSGGSPGKDAARNVGIVLGLGGLSFFLGFFVLSRMVPDRHDEAASPAATPASAQSLAPATQIAQDTPPASRVQPSEATPAPVAPAPRPASSSVTIEPADETTSQKPASLDKAADRAASSRNQDGGADKSADNAADKMDGANSAPDATLDTPADAQSGGKTAPGSKRGSAAVTPSLRGLDDGDTPAAPAPRRTRRSRTRGAASDAETGAAPADTADNGGISEGDQKPSRIDRDQSDAQPAEKRAPRRSAKAPSGDSADDSAAPPARAVKRSRYRVAAGAFAQREAAERAVGRVTDLGMEATVVPVTKEDGTTVYRVQQGVYRSRANAEAARQKLSDAGLDAEVVKTGG